MNKTTENTPAPPHDLILENREKLTITGGQAGAAVQRGERRH